MTRYTSSLRTTQHVLSIKCVKIPFNLSILLMRNLIHKIQFYLNWKVMDESERRGSNPIHTHEGENMFTSWAREQGPTSASLNTFFLISLFFFLWTRAKPSAYFHSECGQKQIDWKPDEQTRAFTCFPQWWKFAGRQLLVKVVIRESTKLSLVCFTNYFWDIAVAKTWLKYRINRALV